VIVDNTGHTVILDTGTTSWFLPSAVVTAISLQVKSACAGDDRCGLIEFAVDNTNFCVSVDVSFLPPIQVTFQNGGGSTVLSVPPTTYFTSVGCGSSNFVNFGLRSFSCSDIDGCLYGDGMMAGFTWVFDRTNGISVAPQTGCDGPVTTIAECPNPNITSGSMCLSPFLSLFLSLCLIFAISKFP